MPNHVRQIAEELRECAGLQKASDVFRLMRILADELARMSPEDFPADRRAEFLKLRYSLNGRAPSSTLANADYEPIEKLAGKIVCIVDKMRASETANQAPTEGLVSGARPDYYARVKRWAYGHRLLVGIIVLVIILSIVAGLLNQIFDIWEFLTG